MNIVEINSVNFGSTGKIMLGIAEVARKSGYDVTTFSQTGRTQKNTIKGNYFIGSIIEKRISSELNKITGINGKLNLVGTYLLISKLKKIKPTIIHLHNLHNNYINIPILFAFIKKHNISVVWTLHDCWAFTGQCPHFTMAKCDKWKTGCYNCSQYKEYPAACFDRTKKMWVHKKNWFSGVENLIIVTPSQWLAQLVKESFLKDYPVRVINNGIDLNIFKPINSDFRNKYNITAKYIVLGVAFGWGKRKGLDVFIELASKLDDEYQIVIVGTDDNIDKMLPNNIISIHRTQNQYELAEIYTVADVLANPTREENYPTVNMESIACGTPVVTFETGGSPEILDENCGSVVKCNDIDSFIKEIKRACTDHNYSQELCLKRARRFFDMNDRFNEYVDLYNEIVRKR